MPIRTKFSADMQAVEDTIAFFGDFNRQADAVATNVGRSIRPFLLDELRFYPAKRPTFPFVWSVDPQANARARRWYFANVVRGKTGGRYQRTGNYARSWRVKLVQGGMEVSTNFPGARWTGGSLAKDVARARRWQIPSHRRTTWPVSSVTINYWAGVYIEELAKALADTLNGSAVTPNRRITFTSQRR